MQTSMTKEEGEVVLPMMIGGWSCSLVAVISAQGEN